MFDELKKNNKKITPQNIPAATQFFTPHWIVRYLVENSLGRLWMLNRPRSKLVEKMDYYIKPEQAETVFLHIGKPEEIKICDLACGSGHMLTYAFDLLYTIYEEEGYEPSDIPEKILTHNLYGIEIDERAGNLAAFALAMKARAKQRRIFNKGIEPNICVLENVQFNEGELDDYMDFVGRDLFNAPLQTTLHQFEEVDNFGSLIRPDITDVAGMLQYLESTNVSGNLFLSMTHQKMLQALWQADYLSPKYHVVITNPPYMEISGANGRLKSWSFDNYPDSASNLFAMFMERSLILSKEIGMLAMINMQAWMFLSSFYRLREKVVKKYSILSMAHLGEKAFDSIGGEVVSTTAFVIQNIKPFSRKGEFIRLVSGKSEAQKAEIFRTALKTKDERFYFRAEPMDFEKVPEKPIAYWVSDEAKQAFIDGIPLSDYNKPLIGMRTGNNVRYLRFWYEVSFQRSSIQDSLDKKWFPYTKGGEFRRWYGNNEYLVNWLNSGYEIKENTLKNYPQLSWDNLSWKISNESLFFKKAISWTCVSNSTFSARYIPKGSLFDTGGSFIPYHENCDNLSVLAFLNAKSTQEYLSVINPTINYGSGTVGKLPWLGVNVPSRKVERLIDISKEDWDAYETSWDFTNLPLLIPDYRQSTLKAAYQKLRTHWREMTLEMQKHEEEKQSLLH